MTIVAPDFDSIVVGSGFSGVAAAQELLHKGHRVLMVDGGKDLPVPVSAAKTAGDAELLVSGDDAQLGNKAHFGSYYCYEGSQEFLGLKNQQTSHLYGSLAVAGLSNVWGMAALPYRAQDIGDWPVTREELDVGYRKVLQWLPVHSLGPAGNIEEVLGSQGFYSSAGSHYLDASGRQVQDLLLRHSGALREQQIYSSAARLALRPENAQREAVCTRCGKCLDGCAYDCFFSTRGILSRLRAHPSFTYRSPVVVTGFEERPDCVVIASQSGERFSGGRLLLAAGALHTTGIVAGSCGWEGRQLELKDSHYWLSPFLSLSRLTRATKPEGICLSHSFLEILEPAITERLIHLQVYGANAPLKAEMSRKLGFLPRSLRTLLADNLYQRSGLIQAFLHSSDSPSLQLGVKRDGDRWSLEVLASRNQDRAREVMAAAQNKLRRTFSRLGLHYLSRFTQHSLPGRGFHSGGTLPMSRNPAWNETDTLGRPGGLQKVHCVDASVLPSIAASTITFTIAANSARIAAQV
jgi:choline dehydrogenase-like flavoprotein